jgi:peptidoglycan/LPS O-acetylase OafA/YrhL
MYHTTVISVSIILLNRFVKVESPYIANVIFYIVTTFGTLLVSHLSYKYFESIILKINKY